jgi:hypothetical protein
MCGTANSRWFLIQLSKTIGQARSKRCAASGQAYAQAGKLLRYLFLTQRLSGNPLFIQILGRIPRRFKGEIEETSASMRSGGPKTSTVSTISFPGFVGQAF